MLYHFGGETECYNVLQDQTFGSRPILEVVAERYFFYFSLTKTTEWNELLGTN